MTRWITLAALAGSALMLTSVAVAKGPTAARVSGPGLDSPLVFVGAGENGSGPFGTLTNEGGFFATTFGQVPDARLPGRPGGNLGPRYTVDYTLPTGETQASHVNQDVYPYANGGPVLYVAPGQVMFNGRATTVGGWIRGPESLRSALVAAGLPASAPGSGSGVDLADPALLAGLAAVFLAVGGAVWLGIRRHGLRTEERSGPGSRASSAQQAP